MSTKISTTRIGVFDTSTFAQGERHGCGLWAAGYEAVVEAAGAAPVPLAKPSGPRGWDEVLAGLHGVIFAGDDATAERFSATGERLCRRCREVRLPLLGIDHGMHILNAAFGGSNYEDLPRELPEALQHRHPPEKGIRHAIAVEPGTLLADFYGEGEVVVNSEHRRAVCKVAKGFRVSGRALDGVIEAIEAETVNWFAMGVQWHPASTTASGLDIQLFRGMIEICEQRAQPSARPARVHAA